MEVWPEEAGDCPPLQKHNHLLLSVEHEGQPVSRGQKAEVTYWWYKAGIDQSSMLMPAGLYMWKQEP